ncbi:hypothetical protein [Streptomyces sp. NPDC001502]|uniref:hypothetical protein n=1 Tax=Streptomyces sp. NPDC001502 TaxID=3364578 RepID=UPI003697B52E
MLRGTGWIVPAGGEPVALGEGDVAIVTGGAAVHPRGHRRRGRADAAAVGGARARPLHDRRLRGDRRRGPAGPSHLREHHGRPERPAHRQLPGGRPGLRAAADPPGWYRALGDPVTGRALRPIHDRPERPWTVAGLAEEAGVSRAAFARWSRSPTRSATAARSA